MKQTGFSSEDTAGREKHLDHLNLTHRGVRACAAVSASDMNNIPTLFHQVGPFEIKKTWSRQTTTKTPRYRCKKTKIDSFKKHNIMD